MIKTIFHHTLRYDNQRNRHVYSACETFRNSCGEPLGSIGKRIVDDNSIEPDKIMYKSLLAEYSLFGLFEALGTRDGWEIGYPIERNFINSTGNIKPLPIGRRLGIEFDSDGRDAYTEIDALVSITFDGRKAWAVLEAKSGVRPPTIREIQNQVRGVCVVTGKNPHYVLGIPNDNLIHGQEDYHRNRRAEFMGRGGIIVTFDESSADFERNAQSMFYSTMGVMSEKV